MVFEKIFVRIFRSAGTKVCRRPNRPAPSAVRVTVGASKSLRLRRNAEAVAMAAQIMTFLARIVDCGLMIED